MRSLVRGRGSSLESKGVGLLLKGSVVVRKSLGRGLEDGVRLFNESGKFRFRVNGSLVQWYLKVKQLTPAEAELYTPR